MNDNGEEVRFTQFGDLSPTGFRKTMNAAALDKYIAEKAMTGKLAELIKYSKAIKSVSELFTLIAVEKGLLQGDKVLTQWVFWNIQVLTRLEYDVLQFDSAVDVAKEVEEELDMLGFSVVANLRHSVDYITDNQDQYEGRTKVVTVSGLFL
jgi:hypothetical protein